MNYYAEAVLKFVKLNTVAQQREAVVRGRSLLPYRLRYSGENFKTSCRRIYNLCGHYLLKTGNRMVFPLQEFSVVHLGQPHAIPF
jgi:hypothetical protein